MTTILLILALLFGGLAVSGVKPRVNWAGAGVLCLAIAALIGSGFTVQ